jgi:two-component system response regulator VicR
MKVLVIEDDREVAEAIRLIFHIRWPSAEVVFAERGTQGIELSETEAPDIIILDLWLPDITGFEVLKQIRLFSAVPIIVVTVSAEEQDIVKGLEWGADDYLVKPFRQLELLSRVRAVMRRGLLLADEPVLIWGGLRLSPTTQQLFCGEQQVDLTQIEARILQLLMRNAGGVVTHSGLSQHVWGDGHYDASNSLKVHIYRLRRKLQALCDQPKLIGTRRGVGYCLERPEITHTR